MGWCCRCSLQPLPCTFRCPPDSLIACARSAVAISLPFLLTRTIRGNNAAAPPARSSLYNPPQRPALEATMISLPVIVTIVVVLYLLSSIKILAEYERGVIFRFGRLLPRAKGPGIILVFAPVDRI